jgi:hypothetical protein
VLLRPYVLLLRVPGQGLQRRVAVRRRRSMAAREAGPFHDPAPRAPSVLGSLLCLALNSGLARMPFHHYFSICTGEYEEEEDSSLPRLPLGWD